MEADMVGQANNMFWLLMDELQDGGLDLDEVDGWWSGGYEGDYFATLIILVNSNFVKKGY